MPMKALIYSGIFLCTLWVLTISTVFGQFPPKDEDQLKRQKILINIPLTEKINKPLTFAEELIYTKPRYSETKGIVESLLMGLKMNKYNAYHGDSLTWAQALTWNDVLAKDKKLNDTGAGEDEEGGSGFEEIDGEAGATDGFEDTEGKEDALDSGTGGGGRLGLNAAPYVERLEIIEDRIFDKKRSDMYYDVQFIRLVWVDPGAVAPDNNFIAFRYTDVMAQLDDTQWKNPHNDQEYRSMREVIELRMYHGVITDVSGRSDVQSLDLAEYRRNQMVEYEHNLWHY